MTDQKTIIDEALYKDEELQAPAPTITIQGKIIATPGNFITINGLPKNFKTTVMQFFVYSALSNNSIFDIQLNCNKDEKIIIIDTEQGKFDFYRQVKRLKNLLQTKSLPGNLLMYLFRRYEPIVILQSINEILIKHRPKYLIIDNLTELVTDPNNMVEAKNVVQLLKTWTADYDTTIICLLHLGKTTFSSLGNLGSYADRGAQSTIKVSFEKDIDTLTIEANLLRSDKHFENIAIRYDEDSHQWIRTTASPKETKTRKFSVQDLSPEDHYNKIGLIFRTAKALPYAEIIDELKRAYGIGTSLVKQKLLPFLLSAEYLLTEKGIYKPISKI